MSFSLPIEPPAALLKGWQVRLQEDISSTIAERFNYIAADADIRRYSEEAHDWASRAMSRLDFLGSVGRTTLQLVWQSAFATDHTGSATYRFVPSTMFVSPISIDEYGGQTDTPPLRRWKGVSVARDSERAVISGGTALMLVELLKDRDPESSARLREVAEEVLSSTRCSRSDPGDDIDDADDEPATTALARRLLGINPPEAQPDPAQSRQGAIAGAMTAENWAAALQKTQEREEREGRARRDEGD